MIQYITGLLIGIAQASLVFVYLMGIFPVFIPLTFAVLSIILGLMILYEVGL